MIALRAQAAGGLFTQAVAQLHRGAFADTTRNGERMLELVQPVSMTLLNPHNYLVTHSRRWLNPWVSLAEFPWMVTGRDDVEWLSYYLPRAGDFSDDGATWRAAYGPRMRAWYAPGRPKAAADQLRYVIDEVKNPWKQSRRGVITLWDPRTDHHPDSRDYPCTNWLSFQKRPTGHLDLLVGMRSNDLWWGWSGVNVVNWSLLLQAVAQWAGLEVGTYTHVADNLHLYYDRHGDAARAVYEAGPESFYSGDVGDFGSELRVFEGSANSALSRLLYYRDECEAAGRPVYDEVPYKVHHTPWVAEWAYFMGLYSLRHDPDKMAAALEKGFGRERRRQWVAAALNWVGVAAV